MDKKAKYSSRYHIIFVYLHTFTTNQTRDRHFSLLSKNKYRRWNSASLNVFLKLSQLFRNNSSSEPFGILVVVKV